MKKNKVFIIIVQVFIILTVLPVINFDNSNAWTMWAHGSIKPIDLTMELGSLAKNKNGIAICTALNDQDNHHSISDGAGGAYIVWEDDRVGGDRDIYIQRVNSWGKPMWTSNGILITTAAGDSHNPKLCSDGVGGAIITWNDDRAGTNDIYAQRINSNGVTQWTNGGVLVCGAVLTQQGPVICSDGANGAIITWQDQRDGNDDIYARRINSTGTPLWTTNGVVICNETNNQVGTQIVADDGGGAIIAWQDARLGTNDIYAQKIDSGGVTQWTDNGTAICNETSGGQASPYLCSDGAGGAIIAWQDGRDLGTTAWDVYAQKINSGGVIPWIGNGTAICTASGSQLAPKIISDGFYGAIVIWKDQRTDSGDIYAQRLNASGDAQWTINGSPICSAADEQAEAEISSDGMGNYILAWEDDRLTPGFSDIYIQKIDSNGLALWAANGVATCTAFEYQGVPRVCSNGVGGAIISWEDYRNNIDNDMYVHTTTNLFFESNLPILLIASLETSQTSVILIPLIIVLILAIISGMIVIYYIFLKKKK